MLQFYSASTSTVNSKRAIAECIENALIDEPNLDCDLLVIYTSIGHNFKELINEAKKISPSARIIGCTGAGVIGKEGAIESMRALAVMAIKGPDSEFAVVGCESMKGKESFDVSANMARKLKAINPAINMVHFLPSGMGVWPANKAVEGIESIFGKEISIFGGNSMDNMKGISTFHLFDDKVYEQGAVMLGFADPELKIVCGATHGAQIIEDMPLDVTKAEGNIIFELNGQSAWKIITNSLGLPESTHYMEVMMVAVLAKKIPEEFHEIYGSEYTLFGSLDSLENEGVIIPSIIETGSTIFLARRDEEKMFKGVDRMLVDLNQNLQNKEKVAVFHADCVLRGKLSFNKILKDEIINRMQYPIFSQKPVPWIGLYSGGEYAKIGNKNWDHQFTSTLSVLYR